ncbi:MAG: hypothetical protein JST54_28850 [Deltaproteobacteria bacterium]|nr:hypothetical protein [Deltaproteobacteria bacterium]
MKNERAIAFGASALAFAIAFRHALSPDVFLFRRDAFRLHLPLEEFIAGELRAGRLPTWYPLDGLGVSLVGSSAAGLLHPRHLLDLLFSPAQALKWTALLSYALAALGTWLLARELGAGKPGRALAAAGFGTCGYLMSMSENLTYLLSAAALPWVVLAAERLGRRPSARAAVGLGFALAIGAWSGDLQAAMLQAALAVVLVLARGLQRRRLLALVGAGAIELLWLLPLLPSIAVLARSSGRLGGLDDTMAMKWSSPPVRLFEWALGAPWPGDFIDDLGLDFSRRYLMHATGGTWAVSLFLGPVITALAIRGLLRPTSTRRRVLWAALAASSLVLTLGSHAGLYHLFWRFVPLWSAFRYPEKLAPFAVLPLCLLAARGLGAPKSRRSVLALIAAGASLLVAVALVQPGWMSAALTALDQAHADPDPEILDGIVSTLRLQLAVGGGCLVLLALVASRGMHTLWLAPALQLLLAMPVIAWTVRTAPTSWLERRSPFVDAARTLQGPGRICQDANDYHFDTPPQENGMEVVEGADLLALAPDHGARLGVATSRAYLPGFPAALNGLCDNRSCGTACSRRLGASGGVVDGAKFEALQKGGAALRELARAHDPALVLFADPSARPFAEPVAVRHVATAELAAAQLAATVAHPIPEVVMVGAGDDSPAVAGHVDVERPRPDTLVAHAVMERAGWIVVRESCDPGWRGRLDGAPIPLTQADLAFCAVQLPAGDHRLELHYAPLGWPWAFAGYGAAWLVAGALVLRPRRRAARS